MAERRPKQFAQIQYNRPTLIIKYNKIKCKNVISSKIVGLVGYNKKAQLTQWERATAVHV